MPGGRRFAVRLFPLRGLVFLPHCVLPLHIFEPRYRAMTADALAGDRRIAMALPSADGDPAPLHHAVCVGRIADEVRLPDGRFTFLLHGECRARILRELPMGDRPYRTAEIETMPEVKDPARQQLRQVQRGMLLDVFRRLTPPDHVEAMKLAEFLATRCDAGAFADILTHAAPLPLPVKQTLLATPSVDDRLEALCAALPERVPEGAELPFGVRTGLN